LDFIAFLNKKKTTTYFLHTYYFFFLKLPYPRGCEDKERGQSQTLGIMTPLDGEYAKVE